MSFRYIPTGEILTPLQVRRKFKTTFFPRDVARWDDVLLAKLKLERV